MEVVDRSRRSQSRKRPVSSHDLGLRELGEVRGVDDSVPVSLADEPSGAAKAQKGSLWSVDQLQWWMTSASWIRNHIAFHHNMKVLGVILIGLLLSILGWPYIATHSKAVRALGVGTMECKSPCSVGCFNGVCSADKINNPSWPMPMANEGMRNDPILEPKHKIFLSHSGAQKEFVEHLCKALEDRFYYPFFDRRLESLPKGEQFPELIVQAAEQCKMLIVVVSEEYFMSKWPMIELSAFVKAHKLHHGSKNSTKGPKILPLFYGLSKDDLKDATRQSKWFQRWETLAKADPKKRIKVGDWKYALDVLKIFNGLPYDKNLKEIVAYEEKIVSCVSKSILPDIRWDDSHVQGKSNILKVIGENIERIGVSRKYNVKVVGLYGVGGIGKTTTCKILCNELSNKYEGKVCHIEFPNAPWSDSKKFFQKVLQDLTVKNSVEVIQHLNEGECKDVLRKRLLKQRTFLAIDNVMDNYKSIELAKTLLELPYHPDSLVVVTARSQSVLEILGINGDAYLEMPDLEEVDAVKVFLHHVVGSKEFLGDEVKRDILTCVRRCYFSKGDGQGHHYHPLALQALGLQLNHYGEIPSIWVENLPRVETFNSLSGGNHVFDVLRSSFDLLSPRDQTFFMDVGFSYMTPFSRSLYSEWLFDMYMGDEEIFLQQVKRLKQKGLMLDVDLRSKRISMHDLYCEFAHLEAKRSLNELELGERSLRKWLFVDNGDFTELVSERGGGYWHKLIRLSIKYHCRTPWKNIGGIEGLEDIKWNYFSNLEVLLLCGLYWRHGALKLEDLRRLKILEIDGHIDGMEGLEKLKHLTYFTWIVSPYRGPYAEDKFPMQLSSFAHILDQLPSSLKQLKISGNVVIGSDLLARCHHLSNLKLHWVVAHLLDLRNCSSLERVSLWGIQKLQTLSGLDASRPSSLQSLDVLVCLDLVDILGIDHLFNLKKLLIIDCPKFEVPSLNGFNQLEILTLKGIDGLTSLAELGDLPALRHLDLGDCKHLMQLPNLSKSRNLQKLNLQGCFALKLHERDIQMLSKLPLLEPLLFHNKYDGYQIKLDLRRGRFLMNQNSFGFSMENEWKERDLDPPPIEIRKLLGPFIFGKKVVFHFDCTPGEFYTNKSWRFELDLDPWNYLCPIFEQAQTIQDIIPLVCGISSGFPSPFTKDL